MIGVIKQLLRFFLFRLSVMKSIAEVYEDSIITHYTVTLRSTKLIIGITGPPLFLKISIHLNDAFTKQIIIYSVLFVFNVLHI